MTDHPLGFALGTSNATLIVIGEGEETPIDVPMTAFAQYLDANYTDIGHDYTVLLKIQDIDQLIDKLTDISYNRTSRSRSRAPVYRDPPGDLIY